MSDRDTRAWLTCYRAAWVLPVAGPPIRDGAVVVEGDRIAWVGRAADLPAANQARIVDLGAALLTPGLVNAHTHLDLTLLRGVLDGLPFFEWIRGVVACRELLSPDELLESARLGVLEGFSAGITTFADTAPGSASFDAMLELGARGIAYLETFGPAPAQVEASLADLATRIAALRARATRRVALGVSPHAPYSVSDALYREVARFARAERLPIATHIAESAAESELVADGSGPFAAFLAGRGIAAPRRARTPVALLEQAGLLGPDTLLIHCVHVDAGDIESIARSSSAVATCPLSNRYFAHGAAPVAAMREAGVRIGIGSDSMASNRAMAPFAETEAVLGPAWDTAGWQAHWELVTVAGARALGLDRTVGTIEPGKAADLAAFALTPDEASGSLPPFGAGARGAATLVLVGGTAVVRNGRTVADLDAVKRRAEAPARRLREWRLRATSP